MADSNVPQVNAGMVAPQMPARPDHFNRPGSTIHSIEHPDWLRRQETAPALHVHQLLGILRRRVFLIIAITLLGAMLAGAAAILIPPKYTARAQIVVEPERTIASGAAAALPGGVDALAIDTQMTMLTARDHLRAVLVSLADDPAFTSSTLTPPPVTELNPTSPEAGDLLAVLQQTATGLVDRIKTVVGRQDAVPSFDEFERTLRIDQERRSRVITVRYTSKSPEQAAAIANRVVELYLQNNAERAQAASRSELSRLNSRIEKLESTLAASEKSIRRRLTATQSGTPGNKDADIPLRQLERSVAENAQLYVNLLERQKQVREHAGTTEAPIRILSLAAAPERPSTPNPNLFILPAIILSLIGGGILAVIIERFDRTLRSEHQVHSTLGIPCIAMVPKLGWMLGTWPHQYLLKKPFSPYAEAIRSIGASLWFAGSQPPPQIVLVSSSLRSEGRTTLATSLAAYAAHLQRRVLLVDLDFRHAAVTRTLKLRADRGMLDLLVSERPLDEVVQRVPELELDVLAMPDCPLDPVALFANGQLQKVLHDIRNAYDYIVIDGPPLLGVTESGLLASLVDTVLFVVKWGRTRREVAQNALNEFHALGWSGRTIADRVRAVVNHVDLKQHARYQYGDAAELFAKNRRYHSQSREVRLIADLRDSGTGAHDESQGGKVSTLRAAE